MQDPKVETGWTIYPTLSCIEFTPALGMDILLGSLIVILISTIMNGINILGTVLIGTHRGSRIADNIMIVSFTLSSIMMGIVTPILIGGLIMQHTDRNHCTQCYEWLGGGDSILWQHQFWYFGHPEVYIIVLPIFGIVTHTLEMATTRTVFDNRGMTYSMISITVIGFVVWGHHMFTAGLECNTRTYYGLITLIIGIPTSVKLYNWVMTLSGQHTFRGYEFHIIATLLTVFIIGGITGLILGNHGIDVQLHDTHFVVAHFHYMLSIVAILGIWLAIMEWFSGSIEIQRGNVNSAIHIFIIGSKYPQGVCSRVLGWTQVVPMGIGSEERKDNGGTEVWSWSIVCGTVTIMYNLHWLYDNMGCRHEHLEGIELHYM